MEDKIKYIATLVVAFTVFNFFYNITNVLESFTMWHLYLVCLMVTILMLLKIKLQKNEQESQLIAQLAQLKALRWELEQLSQLDQLSRLDQAAFKARIYLLLKSYGIETITCYEDETKSGVDFMFWDKGEKYIVRAQNEVEMTDFLTEVRVCQGLRHDCEIMADEVIYLSTVTSYDEDVLAYAKRNNIVLLNGAQLYKQFSLQKTSLDYQIKEMSLCL